MQTGVNIPALTALCEATKLPVIAAGGVTNMDDLRVLTPLCAKGLEGAISGRALYAGDDTTDLDGFRGLDGLELGVRVAVDSGEAPPELIEAADLVVAGPDGVLALLRAL
jgi:trehalose-6-phosphatase